MSRQAYDCRTAKSCRFRSNPDRFLKSYSYACSFGSGIDNENPSFRRIKLITSEPEYLLIDTVLRFAAAGVLWLLTALLLRDARHSWAGRFSAAFSLALSAYLFCSSGWVRDIAGSLLPVLVLACLSVPALLWLTALAIFHDDFRLRPRLLGPPLLVILFGWVSQYGPIGSGFAATAWTSAHQLLVAVLYIHAIVVACQGYGDDLVEIRREFRRLFVVAAASLGAIVAVVELYLGQSAAAPWMETLVAAAIAGVTMTLAVAALSLEPNQMFRPTVVFDQARSTGAGSQGLTAKDRLIFDALRSTMETECLYRTEGLTIAKLASHIGFPEYQLRRVINRELGYRNFQAFLNDYRLREVRRGLEDPACARTPILTLALRAGFGSIAPFNRAFKRATGLTPTAYREAHLSELAGTGSRVHAKT